MELRSIQPGKPVQNAFVESFNGKFRDECLNQSWFLSLANAIQSIAAWRLDYNRHRPHSALGNMTSEEFAKKPLDRENFSESLARRRVSRHFSEHVARGSEAQNFVAMLMPNDPPWKRLRAA